MSGSAGVSTGSRCNPPVNRSKDGSSWTGPRRRCISALSTTASPTARRWVLQPTPPQCSTTPVRTYRATLTIPRVPATSPTPSSTSATTTCRSPSTRSHGRLQQRHHDGIHRHHEGPAPDHGRRRDQGLRPGQPRPDQRDFIAQGTGWVDTGQSWVADTSATTTSAAAVYPIHPTEITEPCVPGQLRRRLRRRRTDDHPGGPGPHLVRPCRHRLRDPLGHDELDAAASVPGKFVYTPPAGTVLNVGPGQTLSVLFTPTDTVDYLTATTSVSIDVAKATR